MALFTPPRPIALLPLAALLLSPPAFTAPATVRPSDDAVRAEASRWLQNALGNAGLRDAQLRLRLIPPREAAALPPCREAVRVEALDTTSLSRLRFAARCPAPDGWHLAYTVRAEVDARVVVASRPLAAGAILTEDDASWTRRTLYELESGLREPAEAVGLGATRPIKAGQILTHKLLESPVLVKRGERIEIVARKDGVEVSVPGESLENGRRGDIVRVKNSASGKSLRARVTGHGEVGPE
ncbi:flagellar basal body P-ring formation chaperone FlgA [Crenobacter luteus]|uniref:Flagella basal body P-ring formation protein FlgA n=1 Tax=Crenobacter luteus TaxID=1452487 RepID=A0A165F6Z1_9NEIS|nr:flagellar basal body P-ring formation chaperone FlgA [Crenobacter luteus]KZE31752.1 flagellar biosynthesis protein FlgA [Crenobacter luteus]